MARVMTDSQQDKEQHTDKRPSSVADKERFSSGGKRHVILLRGRWGLTLDNCLLWLTGWSAMTKQYALATGVTYQPTLLLYTTGARSGKSRRSGLPYFEIDDYRVVRGSNGGGPTDPHWCHNIRANTEVKIRLKGRTRAATAYVAQGDERADLYAKLCALSKSTAGYQKMCAPRELPLVIIRESRQS